MITSALKVCLGFVCFLASLAFAAETQPPAVAITQPVMGGTLSGRATVAVTASDASGVKNVALKIDGAAMGAPVQVSPYSFEVETDRLANGVHTLHAVATDRAGNAARSTIISVNVTNPPQYTLGQRPFVIENLGSVISANTQEQQWMFRLASNNDLHLLLYYDVTPSDIHPFEILDVNLTMGTARLTNGAIGRPGPYATLLYPNNNKIYVGSAGLVEYDPATGYSRQISFFRTNLTGSISSANYMAVGDDGFVYVGKGYSEGVERYNPTTEAYEDLGSMDPDKPAGVTYSYTLGADSRYVYTGLGQLPWYLAVYDNQTKTRTLFWKNDNDLLGLVLHAKAGGLYYERKLSDNSLKWYQLTNGLPVEIAATNVPAYYSYSEEKPGIVKSSANFPSRYNTEIDLADAYPDSSSNRATVRWRTLGATNWQPVSASGFFIQPINIKRLYGWDNTRLFGFADFYGPVFLYDVNTKKTTTLGRPQYSLYDSIFESGGVYLSGYPAATLDYDTTKPWTLTGSATNMSNPALNPYKISLVMGKYHYYSTFGADGLVYVASMHIRDSAGGEIGWYDPLTGVSSSLRTPFLTDDPRDLKAVLGGTKLVYASAQGNLFVFDVASKQVERTIVPIPGTELDKIVEVAPGIVFGAAGTNVFKIDVRSGAVLVVGGLPGQAFGVGTIQSYDRRLDVAPDSYVWMFVGNSLYRINPADGALTKLMDTPAKTLLFKDGDLYLYGGPNLYRVRGVLNSEPPAGTTLLDIPRQPGPATPVYNIGP